MKSAIRAGIRWPGWPLCLAIVLALTAGWPLLASAGLIDTRAGGDSPFLLQRLQGIEANLRAGVFPARWMPDAAFGMGYPFFNYYASLPYYFAALLRLIGYPYVAAIKAAQLLGLVLAAVGAYLLAARLFKRRAAALVASAAYTCAPFHLVNLYVRGDSLSEFWAFAWYPLVLLALERLWDRPTLARGAAVSALYGCLIVAHNVSALIFSPFLLLFIAFLVASDRRRIVVRIGAVAVSLLGAIGLTAWFWAPALLERGLVQLEVQTTGYFHYSQHFRWANLVQPGLGFDYRVDAAGTPFAMGLAQAAVAAAGAAAALVLLFRRRKAWLQAFLLLYVLSATLLMTPWSRAVWDRVPLLAFAQFPWRFLSVQALAVALLAGQLASGRSGVLVASVCAAGLAAAVLVPLRPSYLYISDVDITPERTALYEAFTGNIGSTVRAEYLPDEVVPRPWTSQALWSGERAAPVAVEGALRSAELLQRTPVKQEWAVTVSPPRAALVFGTLYFPGWQAVVDGSPVPLAAQPGWGGIRVSVPEGQHHVVLRFEPTRLRRLAELASLASAVVVLALALAQARPRRHWLLRGGAALVSVALLWTAGRAASAWAPRYRTDDLTMDWSHSPYLHHNPQGVRYSSGLTLAGYDFEPDAAGPGQAIEVILQWAGADAGGSWAEVSLEGVASPLFRVLDRWASSRAAISGGVSRHLLTLPAEMAEGLALLAVREGTGNKEAAPVDASGESIGTTYLRPLRVLAAPPVVRAKGLAGMGDVTLLAAAASQEAPARLAAELSWVASRQLPEHYAVSVRLLAPDGRVLASHDSQPNYGFSPTSLWRTGVAVTDRHWLTIPAGLAPGDGYSLEVILYQARTLAPLGSARVPGIALTMPTIRTAPSVVAAMGPEIALSEASPVQREVWQGEAVRVRAAWAALAAPSGGYRCEITLSRPDGGEAVRASFDLSPGWPTSRWPASAWVASEYSLGVPPDLPAGDYTLVIRLITPHGVAAGEYRLPASLRIQARQRAYTPPAMQFAVGARFGEEISLLGYDVEQDGQALRLTLHWQALRAPKADYQVFVHLFDPSTERIAAQKDGAPRGGAYPTSQWVSGEVVSDQMVLPLSGVSPGTYRLAVGVYDARGRLPAADSAGQQLPADRLVLDEPVSVP